MEKERREKEKSNGRVVERKGVEGVGEGGEGSRGAKCGRRKVPNETGGETK